MSSNGERLPPSSPEAERAVLGAMLRDNGVIADVAQLVGPEHFHADAHQRVFAAVRDLYLDGKPADLVTVAELLRRRGQMPDVGYGLLADLWDAAPTAAHAEHYAAIVQDLALVRGLIRASSETLRDAFDRARPGAELLEEAERRIYGLAQTGVASAAVPLAEALREAGDLYDQRSRPTSSAGAVRTPWPDLDALTAGLQPAQLIVVAARPSVGKTALAVCLTREAILAGASVFFASLEQSRQELSGRLWCLEAEVDGHRFLQGALHDGELVRMAEAKARLSPLPLLIDDTPAQSMLRITAGARRCKLQRGLRLVLVDYLQLVEAELRRASRQEEVSAVSRRLKHLARELNVPVVALAQLNRESEGRADGKPRLSDLRESGAIEADADVVLLLQKLAPEPGQRVDVVEVSVAKQRNGPVGEVKLAYRKEFMRFENFYPHLPA